VWVAVGLGVRVAEGDGEGVVVAVGATVRDATGDGVTSEPVLPPSRIPLGTMGRKTRCAAAVVAHTNERVAVRVSHAKASSPHNSATARSDSFRCMA
jgi:hypothetical protein